MTSIPTTYNPYFATGHLVPTLLGPDPSQLGQVVQSAVPVAQQKIPRSDRLEVSSLPSIYTLTYKEQIIREANIKSECFCTNINFRKNFKYFSRKLMKLITNKLDYLIINQNNKITHSMFSKLTKRILLINIKLDRL